MQLRSELGAVVLGFVALNLALVFGAIGLFRRMGPAIERILLRNDATIMATEDVLEVLARSPAAVPTDDRTRVEAALARARDNVTEPGEAPILDGIAAALEPALSGDRAARHELIGKLVQLIEINRSAMKRVDADAQRIGKAGAWAATLIGFVSLSLSLLLIRRLASRIVRPIDELRDVLTAARAGDQFRRCGSFPTAPELRHAMEVVNELLDQTTPTDLPEELRGPPSPRPGERTASLTPTDPAPDEE
ncbi:MAG: hypothetical protein IPM29_03795 [Planctomycetes bacterium]|nr:hypothetical protein [Planctomycetota bacterium]